MSHFTRIRTALRDGQTLAAALRSLGFTEVEVHDHKAALRGYYGTEDANHAEIIVRKPHAPGAVADIGFARCRDGTFEAVLDAMDRSRYGDEWMTRLARAYGHAAAVQYAADHGYDIVADESEQDGTRRLTLRRTVST
jgi:Protein of unknown function (DUF1257)